MLCFADLFHFKRAGKKKIPSLCYLFSEAHYKQDGYQQLGGFVPLNKTLTYACRVVCSDFTACSCVRSWAANHKIKCHNTFSKQRVWHHSWSTARYLGLHLHFQAGWHLWLPVFTNKKSNYDLPESRALSFSCLATITAPLTRAWV